MNGQTAVSTMGKRIFGEAKQILLIIALVLLSRAVVAETFYVPSGSMEPTLEIGDDLITTKFAYGYSRYSMPFTLGPASSTRLFERLPQRGDVVVFRLPRDPEQTYVKRVIGLPGDRVQVIAGHLLINGEALPLRAAGTGQMELQDGRRLTAGRFIETLPDGREHPIFKLGWNGPMNDTGVYEVPPGHLFMMGDNRDNSLDSRVSPDSGGVGFVPVENLIGRADVILGSWDFPIMRQPVWTWLSGLRANRFLAGIG
jgi:signal peptidase I